MLGCCCEDVAHSSECSSVPRHAALATATGPSLPRLWKASAMFVASRRGRGRALYRCVRQTTHYHPASQQPTPFYSKLKISTQ